MPPKKKSKNKRKTPIKPSNRPVVNTSQVLCALCETETEAGQNFVQCDGCNADYHFRCIGITDISEEDEWYCPNCNKNVSKRTTREEISFVNLCERSPSTDQHDTSMQETDSVNAAESSYRQANQTSVPVIVHRSDVRLEDIDEDGKNVEREDSINAIKSVGEKESQSIRLTSREERQPVSVQRTLSTRQYVDSRQQQPIGRENLSALSQQLKEVNNRSANGSAKSSKCSESSTSSRLRLDHAKHMLDLQELIDKEMYQAKIEAIKAKEARARNFFNEMYKTAIECDASSNHSTKTSKSHVSNWVKDQQRREVPSSMEKRTTNFNSALDKLDFDVSIPVDEEEVERIIQKQNSMKSNLDRKSSKSENIHSNGINRLQFDSRSTKSDRIKLFPSNSEPSSRLVPTSRSTMLPSQQRKGEQPTYQSLKPSPNNIIGKRSSNDDRAVDCNLSYKRGQPQISQSYRNMYPRYTESNQGAYRSLSNETSNPNRPMNPSGSHSNPVVSSARSNDRSFQVQTLNDRTFPRYRMPVNGPLLEPRQIAARQAIPKWLPKFDGNPYDWPNFIKRYENTTNLCGFCDDENLERLDKCLDGKARTIVQSQLMMPECVPEIIQILFERFGRPELVMKATLDAIRNEPNIKHNNLDALSNFGYQVHSACNIIERLGLEYYLYNPELVQEILGKLPHQTRVDFAVYTENIDVVTLRTLANWMRALSRMINRITPIDTAFPDQNRQNDKNAKGHNQSRKDENSKSKNGYLNLHDGRNSSSPDTSQKCVICGNHCKRLEECSKFKQFEINLRWDALKRHNLCRRCLKRHAGYCELSKDCGINGCVYKHNSLLHKDKTLQQKKINPKPDVKEDQSIKTGSNNVHLQNDKELFRITLVELHHNNQSFETYAFLDEGSSFTLMERDTANEINLTGIPQTICLLWTKGMHRQEQSEVVDVEISGRSIEYGKIIPTKRYPLREVNIVEDLELPEQSLPLEEFKRKYNHLKNLPLIGYKNVRPTMIIGLKNARLAVPLETVEGEADEPIATRSRLGWQIYGTPTGNTSGFVNVHSVNRCPCQERDADMHKLVKDHFSIENFGVVANSACLDSKENEKALKLMKENTVRKGNRFETKLLWKNDVYNLPDSYPMAIKRLNCLENKGSKVIETINNSIKDYIEKGYVSKLSPTEAASINKRTWYLPIFTVSHPKKPEKLRTVFDAAAKVQGVSLNSVLFTGPDLSVSIIDILRRFREHRIAVNGDLKEMYHQVTINEQDRDSQRFIWRNGDKTKIPEVYRMNVMTFGATCSPSLAQFVKNLNASQFQNEFPRAAEAIIRNHYIDDLLDGADTVEEAIQLLKDVKYVHQNGGFEIRNFKSNSTRVLKEIGENIDDKTKLSVGSEQLERVLGMFWEPKSDNFTFSLKFTKVPSDVLTGKRLPTKRELLKLLMSIYDPLGLISYFLIHLRILLQDVWRSKIKWDEEIPENLISDWKRWLELLPKVEQLRIPRWYSDKLTPKEVKGVELHVFVDASEKAYSAVAYLRIEDRNGVTVSLIGSKARVTPLKYLSNPRRELLASVLGTRFSQSVRDGLYTKVDRRIIWSDSINVLTWLQSEHQKYTTFVAHRIGEILESTEQHEWRWVPTGQNVADEATKWAKNPEFQTTSRWFSGPEFLKLSEPNWPKTPRTIIPNGSTEEMKMSCLHSHLIAPSIIDINRFSRFERALRAVAYAIRWKEILLSKIRKTKAPEGPITQEELLMSETFLFRQAQWEGFPNEMVTLVKNSKGTKPPKGLEKNSPIYDCLPYLDDHGLLRVNGRIDNATALPIYARRPIIMPRDHRITRLLMLSEHVKNYHRNHETVINELRQRFYIPRIRVAFRSVRWNCMKCTVKRSRPQPPLMADLPSIRFETGIRAFTYTGVDFFGPINVMVGRRPEKRWGVLFTCLTVRAIHIELAHSLDTQSCIMKIRNFINLRGRPAEMLSDRGTNFQGADNELKSELEKLDVKELGNTFTSCYTRWNFNPPASPHMGGAWERMIRTVKRCLEDSLPSRTPKEEMLHSLLIEIMNVVNSRPLTFVPLDTSEDEALTPNHFIFGTSNSLQPPGRFKNDGPYLRSAWKEIQRCTDIFWQRFMNEYIPTLTRRTKWFESVKPIEVGDLVIDFDENGPRNKYKRGKIVETIVGSRGQVRRANVQYANGGTLWRPAVKLGVLDVKEAAPTELKSSDLPEFKTGGRNVGASNQIVNNKFTSALSDSGEINYSSD